MQVEMNNAQMKALAIMIAEHEVMRERLAILGQLESDKPPLRWKANGRPIINLEDAVKDFLENGL